MLSGMRRWSLLTVCVFDDRRTSEKAVTAESVLTLMRVPWVAELGAEIDDRPCGRRAIRVEQIVRRQDLQVRMVGSTALTAKPAACRHDARIGQQQGHAVVVATHGNGRQRA